MWVELVKLRYNGDTDRKHEVEGAVSAMFRQHSNLNLNVQFH